MNYQMGLCLGPCSGLVEPAEYQKTVKEVNLFLKGRMPQLMDRVKQAMEKAAAQEDFEAAAVHRDRLYALEKTLEKQVITTADLKDRDVVGIARKGHALLVMVLFVRGGFLLGSRPIFVPTSETSNREVVDSFIKQYYDETSFIPQEVLLPVAPKDRLLLEERLSDLKGRRVRVAIPRRGEKRRLLDLASKNAEKALEEILHAIMLEEGMLEQVKKALALRRRPDRIECIDLSNIAGTEGVGAVVVFERGKPVPQSYRKYKMKESSAHDDYHMLMEVMIRRFKKGADQTVPDLLMVDGGKGQLNVAVAMMEELDLAGTSDVVAIAKADPERGETEDKIFKPGRKNPVALRKSPDVLLFLQRIRDEAHRFVIRYHRKRRMMTYRKSMMEGIPGIGPKRRATLLRYFGSVKRMKEASLEQIQAVPGMNRKVAQNVVKALQKNRITATS